MLGFSKKLIDTLTASNFYLKFKENNQNGMTFHQLFGPVLFTAHLYGSFAAADACSLPPDDFNSSNSDPVC
jgi:hypothetical protein